MNPNGYMLDTTLFNAIAKDALPHWRLKQLVTQDGLSKIFYP